MMFSVLRKPKPLPARFNRTVTPLTRKLAEKRHQLQKQYVRQRRKRLLQRFERRALAMRGVLTRFFALIVCGVICLLIGLALFSPILQVRQIRIARTDLRLDIELIQESLRSVFGQRMPVLSVESIPPLLTTPLPNAGRSAAPDLASVTIHKVYPSTLQLRLTLKPLAYRLSIDSPDQQGKPQPETASGSDFLTHDGMYVVYRNAQTGSGDRLPLMNIVDWGVRPVPWKKLVSPDLLAAMREAGRTLAIDFQKEIRGRTIFVRGREFHLRLPEYTLWFDMKSPLSTQFDRYRVFLQSTAAGSAKKYVDLRISGKVVYQ